MNYLKISWAVSDPGLKEILVAVLAEFSFESFEDEGAVLHAYIAEQAFDEAATRQVGEQYGLEYSASVIEQQNWNAAWEQSFNPVTVEGFCTIRADFHEPASGVEHEIIITPKMSFGTGHHATTRLMIGEMRGIDFTSKYVLDFGTGTGVLAILAHKMNAAEVVAIDNDEWSYENACENAARNAATTIKIYKGSLDVAGSGHFDVILANINRHILLRYMSEMAGMLRENGILMMSGILQEDRHVIYEAAEKAGLVYRRDTVNDKWLCMVYEKV